MKNHFSRAALAAAVATAIAGCGGSSSSLTSAAVSYEAVGAVADGYLVGANVCLDVNANSACDTDEPYATTGAGGAFTITTSTESDLEAALVVEVSETTVDEDTGAAVGVAYTLTAPAASAFISPITTLAHHFAAQNPAFSSAQVQAIVRTRLGAAAGLDIMADYVAGGSNAEAGAENKDNFERLHRVARVLAQAFGSNLVAIGEDAAAADATFQAKFGVMVDHMLNQLDRLAALIDADITSGDNSLENTDISGLLAVNTATLTERLLQASLGVTAGDFASILTSSASLYEVEAVADEQIEGPALYREMFALNSDGNASFVEQVFNVSSGAWDTESSTDTALFLDADGNWVEGDWSVSSNFTVNADGSASIEYSFGSFDYTAAVLSLSGKTIANFLGSAYDSAPTFSTGAAAIRLAETPAADIFEVSIMDDGDTSMCPDMNCNLVLDAMGSPITSLTSLKSTGLLGGVVLFGDSTATSGSLDMSQQALGGLLQVMLTQAGYTTDQINSTLAGLGAIIPFDDSGMLNLGSWSTVTHSSSAEIIVLDTPTESPVNLDAAASALPGVDLSMLTGGFATLFEHDMDESPMFAEVAGSAMTVVRSGYYFKGSSTSQLDDLWFNEQAMTDIVDLRLGVPDSTGGGDPSACTVPTGTVASEANFDSIVAACGLGFTDPSALVGSFAMSIAGINATTTLNADGTGDVNALGNAFPATWAVNAAGVAVINIDMSGLGAGSGTVKMAPLDATGTIVLFVNTALATELVETTL